MLGFLGLGCFPRGGGQLGDTVDGPVAQPGQRVFFLGLGTLSFLLDVASGQTDLLQHQGHLGAGELFGLGPKRRKFSRRICFFSPIRLVATKLAVGSVPSRSRLTTRSTPQPTPARRPSGHGQSAANETSLWKVSWRTPTNRSRPSTTI